MQHEYPPVEHQKWLDVLPKRASSGAMILETEAGEVLIVKANYKPYWTFPGGIVDPDETPKEAAIRETFEEIGINVDPSKVVFVAVVDRKSTVTQTYQFIFKAPLEEKARGKILLQASEIDEHDFVTKDQVFSNDRHYAKAIEHWANGTTGYIEQTFGIIP